MRASQHHCGSAPIVWSDSTQGVYRNIATSLIIDRFCRETDREGQSHGDKSAVIIKSHHNEKTHPEGPPFSCASGSTFPRLGRAPGLEINYFGERFGGEGRPGVHDLPALREH